MSKPFSFSLNQTLQPFSEPNPSSMTMNQEQSLRECQLEDVVEDEGSESEYDSDDSEDDPSFSIRGDSSSKISHRSTKKKSRNIVNLESESEPDEEEVSVEKLDAKDEKSFELVQKVIEAGQIEKLKVDQCKVYLRKNGLRLTGNKDTLIQRIKEHLEILNGGGEKKYPQSSFVLNCKGDACMGDVVMFEQNVYEMFNLASRSATGPPCGTRIVAGRIVKESYGAAKQQHTFTVEVLWSKGEKPLPPLHPLLIKGRNLYRLRTLRQRWEDEGQRQKTLMEKHSRGSLARSDRDARMEEKKMRKMLKATRISRKPEPKKKQSQPIQSQHKPMAEHPQQQLNSMKLAGASQPFIGLASQSQHPQQQLNSMKLAGASQPFIGLASQSQQSRASQPFIGLSSQSQQSRASQQSGSFANPVKSITQSQRAGFAVATEHQQNNHMRQMDTQRMYSSSIQEVHHQRSVECRPNHNLQQNHIRPQDHVSQYHPNGSSPLRSNNHMNPPQRQMGVVEVQRMHSSSIHEVHHRTSVDCHPNYNLHWNHLRPQDHGSFPKASHVQPLRSNYNHMNPPQRQDHQPCRHYAQGRCYFGENCKYLHDSKDEYPQRREEAWRYGGNELASRPY